MENGSECRCVKATKKLGWRLVWKGLLNEDDPAGEIQILEQFVSEGVGGIVLVLIDDTALKRPVAAAMQKGISVVRFGAQGRAR